MNLFYCLDCRRIFDFDDKCIYCNSENLKELKKNSPVNVIGSKVKGRILRAEGDIVSLIIITENNEKVIKKYEISKLRKVL